MRIVHLTTLLQGGAGRAIADLACCQRVAGHTVDVVTSATAPDGYANYPRYLDELRGAGVGVHLVDSMFSRNPAGNLEVVRYLVSRQWLADAVVVHAHAATPALVAMLARRAASAVVPVVQTMHGWGVRKTAAQQRDDVQVMNQVDALVVPAPSSAEVLRQVGVTRDEIAVVSYGVTAAPTEPDAADVMALVQRLHHEGRTVFCCVGTIGERKNQAVVVDALAQMDGSRAACLFVGDGDGAALADRAEALGVASAVHVLGYRPDAAAVARAADWYILPSHSEGQPLSILEAYRDGVPVLASRTPELAELVDDDETGLLFDQTDVTAVAARMTEAVRMDAARREQLRRRGRERFDTRFSLDAMVRGYAAQYVRASQMLEARMADGARA